jgi:hypothetical protein
MNKRYEQLIVVAMLNPADAYNSIASSTNPPARRCATFVRAGAFLRNVRYDEKGLRLLPAVAAQRLVRNRPRRSLRMLRGAPMEDP